jgi:nucleotide-binding universal stress UspA family protein
MPGIVVGVDGSDDAHRALIWAMSEAAARKAGLTVIAVVPTMASAWTGSPVRMAEGDAAVEHARQAAEDAVSKSAAEIGGSQPASVQVRAFTGLPAQALIEASRDADLVVVGSRGVGGFTSLMLGSISTQVAHHAACPVVIVPSGR